MQPCLTPLALCNIGEDDTLIGPSVNVNWLTSWVGRACYVQSVQSLCTQEDAGCCKLALRLRYAAGCSERLPAGAGTFVILYQKFGLCRNLTANLDGWKVSTRSHLWGECRHFAGLWAPFSSLLQPLHFSFHVNFSTPFTPPHSEISLLSAAGISFSKHLISTCAEGYNRIQYFNSTNAQHVPLFSSLRPSVLNTHLTFYSMREKSLQQSHYLFICLLLGT